MLAIRHHMGAFGGDINTEIAMKDPLVYLVHLADMSVAWLKKQLIIKNWRYKIILKMLIDKDTVVIENENDWRVVQKMLETNGYVWNVKYIIRKLKLERILNENK